MPNAHLTLSDGTKVSIQGSEEEIARIVKKITTGEPENGTRRTKKPSRISQPDITGPTGHIRELVNDGFFKEKRNIGDVQKTLEASSHIYATTSLSSCLVRLTRLHVLRRLKEEGAWLYVQQ